MFPSTKIHEPSLSHSSLHGTYFSEVFGYSFFFNLSSFLCFLPPKQHIQLFAVFFAVLFTQCLFGFLLHFFLGGFVHFDVELGIVEIAADF